MGASAWRRRDDRRRDTIARIGVMYLAVVLTAALVEGVALFAVVIGFLKFPAAG